MMIRSIVDTINKKVKMTFVLACSNAIQRAKSLNTVCRVYQSFNAFYVNSDKERGDDGTFGWLFMAYPGGRKVLSLAGVKLCRELNIRV